MITVLLTNIYNETVSIIIYDDGAIVRHAAEKDNYVRGYVVVEGGLYDFPVDPSDLNKTLYLAERFSLCVYLYLENKHCFVNRDKLWLTVCESMHTEEMSDEDKADFKRHFPTDCLQLEKEPTYCVEVDIDSNVKVVKCASLETALEYVEDAKVNLNKGDKEIFDYIKVWRLDRDGTRELVLTTDGTITL